MKNLFYSTDISDNRIALNEEESVHARKVLRMKSGDEIWITNGAGTLFCGEIVETGKKSLVAEIKSRQIIEKSQTHIRLAIAPTKNMDRMEWLVEKLTELGVSEITPVVCQLSERKVLKTERLHKMAVSAMKQSKQCWLPIINELAPFEDVLKTTSAKTKLIAHCRKQNLPFVVEEIKNKEADYLICIGPEGDFSESEIQQAVKAGFKEISLGNNRLRTETAGLVAAIILTAQNQ